MVLGVVWIVGVVWGEDDCVVLIVCFLICWVVLIWLVFELLLIKLFYYVLLVYLVLVLMVGWVFVEIGKLVSW